MNWIDSPQYLRKRISSSLGCNPQELEQASRLQTASVLLPIQWEQGSCSGPVILLNKRSQLVRQPGDLCCPGGRVDRLTDNCLGWILRLLPLASLRSGAWGMCKAQISSRGKKALAVFWAACLRESWEEMGLFPWKVEFLGVLPLYSLRLFPRQILPMAGWVHAQTRFRPNWEVEKIIPIPLEGLLNPANYARYRISNHPRSGENVFPAYVYQEKGEREVLWGATYWIVESFLKLALGFQPPFMELRPLVEGQLAENYLTGGEKKK